MKKTFAFVLTITILVFAPFLYLIKVNAHNALLEVDYMVLF